jgi:hypothetical protein
MPAEQTIQLQTFAVAYDRRADVAFRPGRLARVAARLRSRPLDRALIDGADPAASPQLAARAAQLTAPPARRAVADALERLTSAPDSGRRWAAMPHRRAVAANAPEMCELASLLRTPVPLYARGIAMLRSLVTDGAGPAYTDKVGQDLALALDDARAAILG